MGSRKQVVRFGAVLAGAALTVLGTACPAFASTTGVVDGNHHGGAPVVLDYVDAHGRQVEGAVETTLIGLRLADGHEVTTYCVELTVNTKNGAPMDEAPWDRYPNPNATFNADRAKVNWVLHNSFPAVPVAALSRTTGIAGLTEDEAIAGTQAAIWHYSNGAGLAKAEADPQVAALYRYLIDPAHNRGIADEPKPTLTITPERRSGHAGDKIGPFTLETTATRGTVTLDAPAGVTIVDANGREIPGGTVSQSVEQAHATDAKADFYLQVPAGLAPGSATVKIDGQATLDEGRLFVGHQVSTQTLIVAKSEVVSVSARSTASWTAAVVPTTRSSTPAPTTTPVVAPTAPAKPPLANTGVSIWPAVGLAALLLAGGAGALLVQRRRRA